MFSQFKGREILGTPFIFNQKHISVFVLMPVDEILDINGVVWKHSATSKGCALSFVYQNVNQSSEVYVETMQQTSTGNDYICTSSMPSTAAPTTSRDGEC
jgi:hypothetical protein